MSVTVYEREDIIPLVVNVLEMCSLSFFSVMLHSVQKNHLPKLKKKDILYKDTNLKLVNSLAHE